MRAVLERDFLAEVVRPRTFWFRTLVAAAVSFTVLAVALDNPRYLADQPDRAAKEIFLGGAFTLLALLAVLTPPAVVGSVLEERNRETLPLVLASPVRPAGFALAKLLARSGTVFAWALGAVVPLTAMLLLGGVDTEDIATAGMLAAGVVLEMAAWSLWLSTVSRRMATAAVGAYLLPAGRWALTGVLAALVVVPPWEGAAPPSALERQGGLWAAVTTPLPGCFRLGDRREYDREMARWWDGSANRPRMIQVRTPSGTRWMPAPPPPPGALRGPLPLHLREPAAAYLLCSLLAAGAAVLAAGRRLRYEAEPRRPFLDRWKRTRRLLRRPPGDGNPVAWKESRLLNTAASRPMYYGTLLLLLLSTVGYALAVSLGETNARERREIALGLASGQACLLGLVAVVAAAASIAQERTSGTLDLLRASPVTAREFFRGKEIGALRGLGFLLLVPALHLLLVLVLGDLPPVVVAASALVLLLSSVLWTGVGLHCGLLAFRTGPAVGLAGGAYGLLLLGVPALGLLLEEGFREREAADLLFGLWPPAWGFLLPEAALRWLDDYRYMEFTWDPGLHREHAAALLGTLLFLAAAILLHALGPRLAARRFEREREAG